MRSHVRSLDAAMASLRDTIIEVRRDTEATFMQSGIAESGECAMFIHEKFHRVQPLSSDGTGNDGKAWSCIHSLALLVVASVKFCLAQHQKASSTFPLYHMGLAIMC